MRQVRAIFATAIIGSTLTLTCLTLLSSTRTFAASGEGIGEPVPDAATHRELPALRVAAFQSTTSSAPFTPSFGTIEIITSVSTLPEPTDVSSSAASRSAANALAKELALAMDVPAAAIRTAEFMCDDAAGDDSDPTNSCTDPAAAAAMGLAPGTWFPTHGPSFALLSTGRVAGIPPAQDESDPALRDRQRRAAEVLNGLNNNEGNDLVRLHLQLEPPPDARCLALDFTLYTLDLPLTDSAARVCRNPYGDTFTAQLDDAHLQVVNAPMDSLVEKIVDAPGNIAFNAQGQQVSTSTMLPNAIYKALSSPLGSTIPGAFPLLQMRHAVTGGQPLDLYLSIQDLGDSAANSAVALDNFTWITDTNPAACLPNRGNTGDRDGDGLPDGWEEHGTYARDAARALQYLDLKTLGADPNVKDVFVEVDALPPWTEHGHTYDPHPLVQSMDAIAAAFARAPVDPITPSVPIQYKGIRLHLDYNPDATITGVTVPQPYLCGALCGKDLDPIWQQVDNIKQSNFAITRTAVYHYALFANRLADCTGQLSTVDNELCGAAAKISGISRNLTDTAQGASDFIVSLGDDQWSDDRENLPDAQAGTFMHELGHNLGLNHYGVAGDILTNTYMRKPNHLSVMNYLYQTKGLVVSDRTFRFDYSRYNMAVLDEEHLAEAEGLRLAASGIAVTYTLGARYYCFMTRPPTITEVAGSISWNCHPPSNEAVKHNINGDRTLNTNRPIYSKLAVVNEWDQLAFTGGLLNRQRSILSSSMGIRTTACSIAAQPNGFWMFPQEPGFPSRPFIRRAYIPVQSVISSDTARRVIEELTPDEDVKIPRYAIPPLERELPYRIFDDRIESLRDWTSLNLPAPVNTFLDIFLAPAPAATP